MNLKNKEAVYKLAAAAGILVVTFWVLVQGASFSSGGSGLKIKSNVVSKDGLKYRTVNTDGPYTGPKEKATFVTLVRNRDLYSLIGSIASIEDRFNRKFHYDWLFLNDEEFDEEFIRVTTAMVSGTTKYGLVPKEHWSYPEWIDKKKAAEVREEMGKKGIIYGDSESYRHMCRFESGFFYRQKELDDYDWYWRVEPDTRIHCDINYDVFKFMRDNNKKYGFTISIREYPATIETLWKTTREFMDKYPQHLHPNNMLDFISDDQGASYNLCHFWSNFEIGWLDLWRGDAYSAYFDYLDQAGGFFYERWGDAPVHSIAAALLLDRSEIHHFGDVGYYHVPFHSCPIDDAVRLGNRCACNPQEDFTWRGYSCTTKFYTVNDMKKPTNWMQYTD
ncbi:LAFE_0E13300g1_1 [Lachancea fermentati]|uniref:LAFE_0E13300g1_1 n=1 Tax=Lachancea fermentati TaxID=4955 RepID=A0A1G4ME67_LACFM|nr:LAFE_0E13300g1_1 [Lachancea fermentati]